MDDPISNSPEKEQSELLTIVGDIEVGEPYMFGNGMYFMSFIVCATKLIYLKICRRKRRRKIDIRT